MDLVGAEVADQARVGLCLDALGSLVVGFGEEGHCAGEPGGAGAGGAEGVDEEVLDDGVDADYVEVVGEEVRGGLGGGGGVGAEVVLGAADEGVAVEDFEGVV